MITTPKDKFGAWPAMMLRSTAAAYLDMSVAEFEHGISDQTLPLPIAFISKERWSKEQIDAAIAVATGEAVPDWRAKSALHNPEVARAQEEERKVRKSRKW